MGTKPGIKRYNRLIYTSCGIIIGLSLSGCIQAARFNKTITTYTDDGHQKVLTQIEALIDKKNFQAAAKINDQTLKLYKNNLPTSDMVLKNYIKQAEIIQAMIQMFLVNEKEQASRGQTIAQLNDNIAHLDDRNKKQNTRIKALKQELDTLKKQIERIKEIDLNK